MKKLLTAMVIVAMATVTANAGLIHQWDFEGNADDSVGSANGSLQGSAAITTGSLGKYGEAVSLDGTSGTNVDISGGAIIPTSAFTLAVWVNPTSNPQYANVMGSQTSANAGAFIRIDSGTPFGRTLPINSGDGVVSGGTTPVGSWTHIALTYEKGGNLTLYVNGSQVSSVAASTNFVDSPYFRIGARGDQTNTNPFDGLIDDVRIYDTALSVSEINDTAMVPVPEPATLALLGLGALVLRRRK